LRRRGLDAWVGLGATAGAADGAVGALRAGPRPLDFLAALGVGASVGFLASLDFLPSAGRATVIGVLGALGCAALGADLGLGPRRFCSTGGASSSGAAAAATGFPRRRPFGVCVAVGKASSSSPCSCGVGIICGAASLWAAVAPDHEVHGNEHGFEEHVEQEDVGCGEYPDHESLEDEDQGEVTLHTSLGIGCLGPPAQNDNGNERGR
jgi:hypothetical protein